MLLQVFLGAMDVLPDQRGYLTDLARFLDGFPDRFLKAGKFGPLLVADGLQDALGELEVLRDQPLKLVELDLNGDHCHRRPHGGEYARRLQSASGNEPSLADDMAVLHHRPEALAAAVHQRGAGRVHLRNALGSDPVEARLHLEQRVRRLATDVDRRTCGGKSRPDCRLVLRADEAERDQLEPFGRLAIDQCGALRDFDDHASKGVGEPFVARRTFAVDCHECETSRSSLPVCRPSESTRLGEPFEAARDWPDVSPIGQNPVVAQRMSAHAARRAVEFCESCSTVAGMGALALPASSSFDRPTPWRGWSAAGTLTTRPRGRALVLPRRDRLT